MFDLARFLFQHREFAMLEDLLNLMIVTAPNEPRVVVALVKFKANQGRHEAAIATGLAWMNRHGPLAGLLVILSRCNFAQDNPGHAARYATWALLTGPDNPKAYEQLAALRDQASDKRPVVQLLGWLVPWFTMNDTQAVVLLHKCFQVGADCFEDQSLRVRRSRADILWVPYYRALVGACWNTAAVDQDDLRTLAQEPEPTFRPRR